jgi:hypothetical protein
MLLVSKNKIILHIISHKMTVTDLRWPRIKHISYYSELATDLRVSLPTGARHFSLRHRVQTGPSDQTQRLV